MRNIYNEAFAKINMNESSKKQIWARLEQEMDGKNVRYYPVLRWSMAAVLLMAIVFVIPQTRTYTFAVVEYVREIFKFADGTNVEIIEYENETSATIEITSEDYICVENERLYFILEDTRMDITDEVSESDYFRHERVLEDGNKSVILIGGSAPEYGWVELLFDEDGTYITNRMSVRDGDAEWVDRSMHAEGVPTGNPLYDMEK